MGEGLGERMTRSGSKVGRILRWPWLGLLLLFSKPTVSIAREMPNCVIKGRLQRISSAALPPASSPSEYLMHVWHAVFVSCDYGEEMCSGVNLKGLTSHEKCCWRVRDEGWENILVRKKKIYIYICAEDIWKNSFNQDWEARVEVSAMWMGTRRHLSIPFPFPLVWLQFTLWPLTVWGWDQPPSVFTTFVLYSLSLLKYSCANNDVIKVGGWNF